MLLSQALSSSDSCARVPSSEFQSVVLQSGFARGKLYHSPLALLLFSQLDMDLFGWILLLLLCDCWMGGCALQMGRKLLIDVHRASPVLIETGYWDMVLYFWAIWAVIAIIAISMARSKNTGKGKASSSSMERAVKKKKPDTTRPVKKRKGKQAISSSESEDLSESVDEEIEAMFAEDSEGEHEKWVQLMEKRGFRCERGVNLETFLYTHPIRVIIQEQNMHFVHSENRGYLPSVVREFYSNLRENPRVDSVLETSVMGKQLRVTPDSIAHALQYVRPDASDRPYPLRAITSFDAQLFSEAMCTHPVPMSGFMRQEFVPGKLKPEYALMNKIIHNRVWPTGCEKFPSQEQIHLLYEVMTGKLIDYALVVWCAMREFLQYSRSHRNIPFPSLVTSIVEEAGMRGTAKEKRVIPRQEQITAKTLAKSRAASSRPQPPVPPAPTLGTTSSTVPAPMSTSPLKRMERRIKGWFKCILGKQKQLDRRLARLESHIFHGEPAIADATSPELEGESEELDDCVDEDAFSSDEDEDDTA